MSDDVNALLGLDNLLESDMSSYELYHSLSKELQSRIADHDVGSFGELCSYIPKSRR